MPQAPDISVIIPVFNAEKYLRPCLDSVLNQTFRNWEALLIDDCSSDNSLRILKEYAQKDSRFIAFQNPCNLGPGPTRNNALKTARGKWVLFLDSDDFWEPDLLRQITRIARDVLQDIICFRFVRVTVQGVPVYTFPPLYPQEGAHGWTEKLLCQSQLTTDKAFRRTFLEKWNIHFASGRLYSEDILFSCSALARAQSYYYLPLAGYCYRQTPGSCTADLDKLLRDWQKVQRLLKRELNRLGVFHEKWYSLLCASLFTVHIRPKAALSSAYFLHYRRTRQIMRKLHCTPEDFKDNAYCNYEKYRKIRSRPFWLFHLRWKNIPALVQLCAAHMKRGVQNLLK